MNLQPLTDDELSAVLKAARYPSGILVSSEVARQAAEAQRLKSEQELAKVPVVAWVVTNPVTKVKSLWWDPNQGTDRNAGWMHEPLYPLPLSAAARIAELEARLEIDPNTRGYDGIVCRDVTIRELEREFAEAKARCAELEKDAARYQGIKQHYRCMSPHIDGMHDWAPRTVAIQRLRGPSFDEAIDAALNTKEQQP